MSQSTMNSSRFNTSCLADECGVDGIHNDNFLSTYLNLMIDKYCKNVSSMIDIGIDNKYREEIVQCKKFMYILKRATHATSMLEELKYVEEVHNSTSSLSDVSDVICVMDPLRKEFEKLLNQLPLKGFQMLSFSQQLVMIQKWKDCDKLLMKNDKQFREELTEKSSLAQNLQRTLALSLPQKKEKCDSLMGAISNMSIKESSDLSAKIANELLEKKNKKLVAVCEIK